MPVFYVNMDNLEEVSYTPPTGKNWRCIQVGTIRGGFPTPRFGDILYKYTEERGHLVERSREERVEMILDFLKDK